MLTAKAKKKMSQKKFVSRTAKSSQLVRNAIAYMQAVTISRRQLTKYSHFQN